MSYLHPADRDEALDAIDEARRDVRAEAQDAAREEHAAIARRCERCGRDLVAGQVLETEDGRAWHQCCPEYVVTRELLADPDVSERVCELADELGLELLHHHGDPLGGGAMLGATAAMRDRVFAALEGLSIPSADQLRGARLSVVPDVAPAGDVEVLEDEAFGVAG